MMSNITPKANRRRDAATEAKAKAKLDCCKSKELWIYIACSKEGKCCCEVCCGERTRRSLIFSRKGSQQ
jgi:hypothetical protein